MYLSCLLVEDGIRHLFLYQSNSVSSLFSSYSLACVSVPSSTRHLRSWTRCPPRAPFLITPLLFLSILSWPTNTSRSRHLSFPTLPPHHGELYGILAAALFATSSSSPSPLPIYSDHLNAVTLLNDALHHPPLPHSWSSLPARSLYRWIFSVLTSSPNRPSLSYFTFGPTPLPQTLPHLPTVLWTISPHPLTLSRSLPHLSPPHILYGQIHSLPAPVRVYRFSLTPYTPITIGLSFIL